MVNQGFCRLFGYGPEGALERSLSDLGLFSEPEVLEEVRQALDRGSLVSDREVAFVTRDGRRLETLFTAKPFSYGGEECILAVAKDITDLKRSEEEKDRLKDQLRQSQKMEAVGTLASGIAHDFNNILQAVSGYVQLLSAAEEMPDSSAPYLKGIDDSVARASELVRRMLTFSRKMEPVLRPLDLNQEVGQAVKVLERVLPKMVTIETRLSPDRLVINGDPQQLEQVLLNLGTNARDAMPQGGTLTIETEPFHLSEEDARTRLELGPGDYARLKVSDTGVGMDEVTLQQIFDPFFTTKEVGKGTGLGLSMVYGIVEGHRGSLSCQSTPGKSTTFSLCFPALDPNLESQVAEPEPRQPFPRGEESILLVDDEEVILEIGRELLNTFGFTTLVAASGEEALKVYRRSQEEIDLVILDLNMPGMGGETCLRELLKLDPEAKVIIASGYSVDTKAEEALARGARGFVPKPYRLRDLAKAVRSVLDKD
jgi:PAS domain S-box-containing protein